MAKGYTPGADGTLYVGGNGNKQPSGYLPQLLNPIEDADVQPLLRDNVHVAQEKFDGRRLLLRKEGAAIDGINRKGLLVGGCLNPCFRRSTASQLTACWTAKPLGMCFTSSTS
jgi:hypothetical protein